MSSSVLSNTNCCGPVTGLLSNPTFLLHAHQSQQQKKTIISPPPIWRTFYTTPSSTTTTSSTSTTALIDDNCIRGATDDSVSQHQHQIELTLLTENLPNQRMTLQKLSNSIVDQKSSIMSVSKLVRPTPKNQHHPHHHPHPHSHPHPHHHQQQQQQHQLQNQHQHGGLQHHQHQHQHSFISDMQTGPINLVTNSQPSDTTRSRPSSTSSVDIESDDIPETQQKNHQHQHQQQQQNIVGVVSSSQSHQISTIPAAYQLNYNHLYGNKSSYNSSNAMAAAADTLRLHASYSYAAIAAVAAASASASASASSSANNNIFSNMNAMSSPSLSHQQATSSLAPPPSLTSTVTTTTVPVSVSPRLTDHHQHQQHQHQHQHQHHQRMFVNDNMYSPPLSNGTYLNSSSKSLSSSDAADSSSENYFKVPNTNGKEGSLKHRILTRPASLSDKEEKTSKNATISTYNTTANFKRGSFIELTNGVLRRVEDMRTEDFIQCADRSLHLQLAESTVVKIDSTKPHMVTITFSYDRNRSKADIEVSVDHPFFVYGQGWASCDPEKSHKAFGLKCQRLQVGDICISLTQRTNPITPAIKAEMISKETTTSTDTIRYGKLDPQQDCNPMTIKSELQTTMPPPPVQYQHQHQHQHQHQGNQNSVVHRVPQPQSVPPPPMHFIPCHLPPTTSLPPSHHQINFPEFPDLVAAAAAAAAAYNSNAHLHHMPSVMPPPPSPDAINGFYQHTTQQLYLQGKVTAADLRLQSPSQASTAVLNYQCPSRTSIHSMQQQQQQPQDQPFDASTIASRKRRWSAPEGDCDEAIVQDRGRDHCQNPKLYKAVMAPVTT